MSVHSRLAARSGLFATAGAVLIALSACQTKPVEVPKPPPPVETGTQATNPLTENKPGFYAMPNIPDDHIPVRVGVILPYNSGTPAVKALAA